MDQDTFGDYLDVASSRGLQRLEAKCIDFLLANFEKVHLSPSNPFNAMSKGACNSHPSAHDRLVLNVSSKNSRAP